MIAVIAMLVTMVIRVTSRIDNQSKVKLAGATIEILNAALEQFRDYEYSYGPAYAGFDFPLDCDGFLVDALQATLAGALGAATVEITNHDTLESPSYSSSEVLHFFLSRVPDSRETLDKIDISVLTNLNEAGAPIGISIDGEPFSPLLRIVDPWGTTLRYDYYDETEPDPILREESRKTFPVIISAGPDRRFGTADDITNR